MGAVDRQVAVQGRVPSPKGVVTTECLWCIRERRTVSFPQNRQFAPAHVVHTDHQCIWPPKCIKQQVTHKI